MLGRRSSAAIAIVAIAAVSATLAATPKFQFLRGLSLDAATALRWRAFGDRHDSASSPAVVVALDEETYRTPPFKGTPTIAWTGEIGRVLRAVLDGGASVVGFDVIFPTTIEDSEISFQDGTIGERMRGFDRDFLRSLAQGANDGKVLLGAIRTGDNLILPTAGQRAAVGQMRNIRFLNVYGDWDGVVRRVPLMLSVNGHAAPAMSLELAARAVGAQPKVSPAGLEIGGYLIASLVPNAMTLDFDGGSGDIPAYSLADLLACVDKGDSGFFHRNFTGKIVLFGSKLELEDLKSTSKRFASAPRPSMTERCVSPAASSASPAHGLIDGVFVQATAVNNLVRREAINELGDATRWLLAFAGAAIESIAALTLTPAGVAFSFLALCAAAAGAAAIALQALVAFPVVEICAAGFAAIVGATIFRLFVTDRDKRLLRRNFELYLPPVLIEKMTRTGKSPQLGGEQRDVTVFFSDLVGFSTLSEPMSPSDVVELMNRYLSAMTEVIEAHGGFVDKYVGDAIIAVFGAPVDDPHHAESAVRAALACCARLEALNRERGMTDEPGLAHRIGLNSGPAVMGNIGSKRRFNYTVMGDAVNLAARLEGANRYFGTSIIASERTAALAGPAIAWRELDVVRVKGRAQAVRIFEPMAVSGGESAEQVAWAKRYREGLALWREGDFAAAVSILARYANVDPPSARLLRRSKAMTQEPSLKNWDAISSLE